MGRPHIEFVQALEIAPRPAPDGVFAGSSWRTLSEDADTRACTVLAHLPAGFTTDLAGLGRLLELFCLGGEARLGGQSLPAGGYAYVAPRSSSCRLECSAPAHLLLMLEEGSDADGKHPVHVIDTSKLRWQPSSAPGLSVKWLRIDGQTGDRSWVAASCPRKQENRAEIHPTVEECLMLRGDCLLGRHGEMGPGAYFWRPPYVEHGPLCTRNGAMYFFRTKGGDFDTTYREVPGWERMVQEYFAREPYLAVDFDR